MATEKMLLTLGDGLIALTSVVKSLADTMGQMQQELERRDDQSRARDAALGERIDKLVSAVGMLADVRQTPLPHAN